MTLVKPRDYIVAAFKTANYVDVPMGFAAERYFEMANQAVGQHPQAIFDRALAILSRADINPMRIKTLVDAIVVAYQNTKIPLSPDAKAALEATKMFRTRTQGEGQKKSDDGRRFSSDTRVASYRYAVVNGVLANRMMDRVDARLPEIGGVATEDTEAAIHDAIEELVRAPGADVSAYDILKNSESHLYRRAIYRSAGVPEDIIGGADKVALAPTGEKLQNQWYAMHVEAYHYLVRTFPIEVIFGDNLGALLLTMIAERTRFMDYVQVRSDRPSLGQDLVDLTRSDYLQRPASVFLSITSDIQETLRIICERHQQKMSGQPVSKSAPRPVAASDQAQAAESSVSAAGEIGARPNIYH
jgi:hypothetical protein